MAAISVLVTANAFPTGGTLSEADRLHFRNVQSARILRGGRVGASNVLRVRARDEEPELHRMQHVVVPGFIECVHGTSA